MVIYELKKRDLITNEVTLVCEGIDRINAYLDSLYSTRGYAGVWAHYAVIESLFNAWDRNKTIVRFSTVRYFVTAEGFKNDN